MILVSHDRDFLQDLVETVYSFREGGIKEYLGDINYFLEQHELEDMRAVEMRSKEKIKSLDLSQGKQKHSNLKQKKKLQNKLSKIETEISKLENEILLDNQRISKNFEGDQHDEAFFKKYQQKKTEVEELMTEWEKVQQQIENA